MRVGLALTTRVTDGEWFVWRVEVVLRISLSIYYIRSLNLRSWSVDWSAIVCWQRSFQPYASNTVTLTCPVDHTVSRFSLGERRGVRPSWCVLFCRLFLFV